MGITYSTYSLPKTTNVIDINENSLKKCLIQSTGEPSQMHECIKANIMVPMDTLGKNYESINYFNKGLQFDNNNKIVQHPIVPTASTCMIALDQAQLQNFDMIKEEFNNTTNANTTNTNTSNNILYISIIILIIIIIR